MRRFKLQLLNNRRRRYALRKTYGEMQKVRRFPYENRDSPDWAVVLGQEPACSHSIGRQLTVRHIESQRIARKSMRIGSANGNRTRI